MIGALQLSPKPLLLNTENVSQATLAKDGTLLRISLTGDEKYRLFTPLSSISPGVVAATVAYEDRWFWYHPGVNLLSIIRASIHNVIGFRDRRPVGASTITMQVARLRFKLRTRTILGKISQIWTALVLDWYYSKEDILEAYLNLAPYGANIKGIGAAARIYFRTSAADLSEDQGRLLTLIPQNPQKRALVNTDNIDLIRKIWRLNYKEVFPTIVLSGRRDLPLLAPHFTDRIRELSSVRGEVQTTLDPVSQKIAEDTLQSFLTRNRSLGMHNGALILVDSRTMGVMSYVGSAGYTNRAIQGYVNGVVALRSPGSLLKPLLYGLAIDQGIITPDSLLKDAPLRISNYRPENFERNFLGPISATEALVRSRNVPAIDLLSRTVNPGFLGLLQQVGFTLPKTPAYYGLSLALGSFEVTMEQVVAAYAMLVNDGMYRPIKFFPAQSFSAQRVLSPESTFLVLEMLRRNPPPHMLYGTRLFSSMPEIAWKTGTSFGAKDAWAVGVLGPYIAGVWLGNFDGTPNSNFVGRDAAGPLLFTFLDGIRAELPVIKKYFHRARNLKKVDVCTVSGALASPDCPHKKKGWIIPGISSIRTCSVHRKVFVDTNTGLRLCQTDGLNGTRSEVMEIWDSDLLELFKLAGMARKVPPPFATVCTDTVAVEDQASRPKIISPHASVDYVLRPQASPNIEFSAVIDGTRKRLFWFVNNELVGEGATIFWKGRPGTYTVRAVDDQGSFATRKIHVEWAPE